MDTFFKNILTALLLTLPLCCPAQALPDLKTSSQIKSGTLPDGVAYYLAPNQATRGYADFLLVQKGRHNPESARRQLLSLPHFVKTRPYEFLASKGVGYSHQGYITYPDGATVFTFKDVPTFDSAASDSTLLLIFDLVSAFKGEQAIVVSGDISAASILDKMHVFSLTVVPRSEVAPPAQEYVWTPVSGPVVLQSENASSHLAQLECSWAAPRLTAEQMKTPQGYVTQMLAAGLGAIAKRRVEMLLVAENIPFSSTSFDYEGSASSSSDEHFRFRVRTGYPNFERTVELCASVFSDLSTNGVSASELQTAKTMASLYLYRLGIPRSNEELAQECVAAYLYGYRPVLGSTVLSFFENKNIPDETLRGMFNSFAAALFTPGEGLTLRCETPAGQGGAGNILWAFEHGWQTPPGISFGMHPGDTLAFAPLKAHKQKIEVESIDPVSKGKIWTFSNGMRVLFKKTAEPGILHYAMMVRGGYSYVPDLRQGESAYVGDAMGFMNVAGLSPERLSDVLFSSGIEMKSDISLSDMRIYGSAPSNQIPLILKILHSYATDRRPDPDRFAYYADCAALQQEDMGLTDQHIYAEMDSLMTPDYFYPDTRNVSLLSETFALKVNHYLDWQFSRMNDGMLVFIGDINENALKNLLCRTLGAFSVSNRYSVRPKVEYPFRNGWYTISRESTDSQQIVHVGMASLHPSTMHAYCAFRIAEVALRRSLVKALATKGMWVDLSTRVRTFPEEQLSIFVSCHQCSPDGLPESIKPADAVETLAAVRSAIGGLSRARISASELKDLKEILAKEMSSEFASPEFQMHAALTRVSESKDMVSNYEQHIKDVTLADVNGVLRDLDLGCKVEYVVR